MFFVNLMRLFTSDINASRNSMNEQEQSTVPPVTAKTTVKTTAVPIKFKVDIESLVQKYGELVPDKKISMPLSTALEVMPRDRKRVDAYDSLAKWLKANRDVELVITSNKTKNNGKR